MVKQFRKEASMIVHSQELVAARISKLEAANNAASEHKMRKKKRIQKGGTLSQAEAMVDKEKREERRQAGAGSIVIYHFKNCGEAGHNKRACLKDAVVFDD
ncbi:hypothetical protein Golomagni_00679 [Golovinomyces magnicellulatus]|nr:hypothetical protein Golomagni_00679 [Golovinomyces magnicellulatus]